MRLLFVCSRNRLRSPTAEAVFCDYPGVEVSSAGTATDAEVQVSTDLIEWAEIIFVMEPVHRRRLNERFAATLKDKPIHILGIPDRYAYMEDGLVRELQEKVSGRLNRHLSRDRNTYSASAASITPE